MERDDQLGDVLGVGGDREKDERECDRERERERE